MRNRGERRFNTLKKLKNWAQRFWEEHQGSYEYYSKKEAERIAKAGRKFPRWVWDPDRWLR